MKANNRRKVFGDAVDLLMEDIEEKTAPGGLRMLSIKKIRPFHDHPFHLYEGERLEDMVASVREHGILNPVIVQEIDGGYEMLSGHNRMNAAKLVGLKEIPAIVKTDLSEEEAYVYVIETNLMQRSFSDLLISEKAAVLKARYEKESCQGRRNDIIEEIARMEGKELPATCGHGDQRLNTRDMIGKEYELSGSSVGRLLKLNDLIKPFKDMVDRGALYTKVGTVGKTTINKVYDPACGSGSLLLKAEKLLGKEAVTSGFYGQEINITTYNLCRINMFLHDIGFDKFDIECEDTLTNPQHWDDEPFELIVSNPPYSIKWAGNDNPLLINDPRFAPAGVLAPKSKADMAFIMHSLSWLAPNGVAAIVCFPGIMYRGGAEKKIRKYLVDNNFVDCIIQLPSNLFFGTPIATCIMVMKRGKTDSQTMFIDASNEYVKVTNNNKLTQNHIQKIVEIYTKREEVKYFSHLATFEEISENDYNLSVSTYVEVEDTREKIDIIELNDEITKIVAKEQGLRDKIDMIIAEIEGGSYE